MQAQNIFQLFPEENPATPFDAFWNLYPRRVAKKDAEKMWTRLTQSEMAAAIAALPKHINYWRQAGRTTETIPHAATWLNGRRFEDELPASTTTPSIPVAPCARCARTAAGGRTMTLNRWVCDPCREDYLAGKWNTEVVA